MSRSILCQLFTHHDAEVKVSFPIRSRFICLFSKILSDLT